MNKYMPWPTMKDPIKRLEIILDMLEDYSYREIGYCIGGVSPERVRQVIKKLNKNYGIEIPTRDDLDWII